ncbi:hypothetical protein ACLOJK_011865 [Asimina triloba]
MARSCFAKFFGSSGAGSQQGELRTIEGKVVVRRSVGEKAPGKSTSLQLYSRTEVDRYTGKGKLSQKGALKESENIEHDTNTITYTVAFQVEEEFGIAGAILVNNQDKHEFFLLYATLKISDDDSIHFECNSWVYPIRKTKTGRLFFSNTCYLPHETPEALTQLRKEELLSLRGDGTGERRQWERIYDYAYYNDLGNPDKGPSHARPVLGGTRPFPYPRRGRTGRPPTKKGSESRPGLINLDIYVPPDERFSPRKMSEFVSNAINAIVHFLIPEAKSLLQHADPTHFESVEQILDMFSEGGPRALEGWMITKLKKLVPDKVHREIIKISKENPVKFPVPHIIAEILNEITLIADNISAWVEDEEFGREMLAGINPAVIQRLRKAPISVHEVGLRAEQIRTDKFPPESRTGKKSSITASHIEQQLEGMAVHEAMENSRLFILDHHDYLMPYVNRINSRGVCIYASRTLLFLKSDSTLKPVAIELTLPAPGETGDEVSRVILPATKGMDKALWQLAKAHVAANDSVHHQLISHWLLTHATVEPFIIATRRQLSAMHPVLRLLEPHFKDTMHINALARGLLLSAGGILEKTLFPGELAMELSSSFYGHYWRFNEQALPDDLLKRGIAVEDPDKPSGVRLVLDDYPYAADGLDIWNAIQKWVTSYCSIFYPNNAAVVNDLEIQAWWKEIREEGHGDKSNEAWWYELSTVADLSKALTTLVWIASAQHASVNFGQYGYAGFVPNRPTTCRKFVPEEGKPEFKEFSRDPEMYHLKMLPDRFTATLGVAMIEVQSTHAADEVYIGQRTSPEWTDSASARRNWEEFRKELVEVEAAIKERNANPKLKNRSGPARIPYTLLYPDTSGVEPTTGITGKGIPNSISM